MKIKLRRRTDGKYMQVDRQQQSHTCRSQQVLDQKASTIRAGGDCCRVCCHTDVGRGGKSGLNAVAKYPFATPVAGLALEDVGHLCPEPLARGGDLLITVWLHANQLKERETFNSLKVDQTGKSSIMRPSGQQKLVSLEDATSINSTPGDGGVRQNPNARVATTTPVGPVPKRNFS
jgi:hypothetical protein